MRYVIPRERDGSLSTSMVELHSDDGAILFVPLVEGNAAAGQFRHWKEGGGVPETAPASPQSLAPQITSECQRRIYAVASQNCQMNMTAWIASGQADEDDRAVFKAALAWVRAMRERCAELIGSGEGAFADDRSWPACPEVVATLAARF